ncbi:MAG TPA: hypothetical protein VES66_02555 [Terriglobales bacterium]|nr:hypothetical protein [Terriglobales bacterium]
MKSNRSLLPVTLARVAWPALLLCAICLGFIPRGFAAEKTETSPWSIQVEPVQAEEGQLPPDFSMAVYEDLIEQLVKTNKFRQVYRSGDHQADRVPNLLVLRMTLLNFERGNETARAVTTVKGATKVQVHLKVSPRDGKVLVEKDVQGTVRFFGENLKATVALAKDIAKTLGETSFPEPAKAAGQ